MVRVSWLCKWVHCDLQGPCNREAGESNSEKQWDDSGRDCSDVEPRAKECGQLLEAGKGKEMDLLQNLQKECISADPFSYLQNSKWISSHALSH